MSEENVEIVRRTYARWADGDLQAGIDLTVPVWGVTQVVFRQTRALGRSAVLHARASLARPSPVNATWKVNPTSRRRVFGLMKSRRP